MRLSRLLEAIRMDLVQPQWDMRSDLPNLNKTLKRSFTDTEYTKKSINVPKKGRCTVCLQLPWLYLSEKKDRPHAARVAMNCLTACRTLSWPARSIFIRAHVGDMIGRRLHLPGNVDDLAQ
ncbi:hypothetical protein TNCV_1837321 [Trichonephila clavipes]|nr:hypothetical protein TNCV_1837321 [Trichonephila clavipes]